MAFVLPVLTFLLVVGGDGVRGVGDPALASPTRRQARAAGSPLALDVFGPERTARSLVPVLKVRLAVRGECLRGLRLLEEREQLRVLPTSLRVGDAKRVHRAVVVAGVELPLSERPEPQDPSAPYVLGVPGLQLGREPSGVGSGEPSSPGS